MVAHMGFLIMAYLPCLGSDELPFMETGNVRVREWQ